MTARKLNHVGNAVAVLSHFNNYLLLKLDPHLVAPQKPGDVGCIVAQ